MNKQLVDSDVIERMKDGDNSVVSDLYSHYFPMVSNYIIKQGGQREDAQDVFSDAIIAILQHAQRENFFLTASLGTYLFAVCQRLWFNRLRNIHKNREMLQVNFDESNLIEQENPLSILEKEDNREFLVNALNHVGKRCKTLLTYYSQNYSMSEIAEIEGYKDVNTVKMSLYTCRKRLRDYLEIQLKKQKINE